MIVVEVRGRFLAAVVRTLATLSLKKRSLVAIGDTVSPSASAISHGLFGFGTREIPGPFTPLGMATNVARLAGRAYMVIASDGLDTEMTQVLRSQAPYTRTHSLHVYNNAVAFLSIT